jgi:hypothetical protein
MIDPWSYAKADTEHGHQVALFLWSAVAKQWLPELDLMFAIPNGGERAKPVAARLKAEGVKRGVPDIFLPVPMGNAHGLFIELKKPKVGRVSDRQTQWASNLINKGYPVSVCYGWKEARDDLLDYLVKDDYQQRVIDREIWLAFGSPKL